MSKMLWNDSITLRKNIVDIEDRGYQFGDGIYEVIGVYHGRPLLMDEHMERLVRSANEIRLKLPSSVQQLKKNLLKLVTENELDEGIIYLQISRGVAPRWHQFPEHSEAQLVAYTRPEERMNETENQGATAILTEDIRWHRCDIKTLNLLPNVLAKQEAVEAGAIEAIMHRGDIVTEASSSNVFIVKDGEIITHPANNYILNGITRRKILQLCAEMQLAVTERTYTVSELLQADEVFVTATKSDIIPILQVDAKQIGKGVPGEICKKILQRFRMLYAQDITKIN